MNTNLIEGLSNLKPTDLDAGQVFSGKPSGTTVKGYAVPSAYTPAIDHDYIFHESSRDVVVWFLNPQEPLYVFGPTGCGKTTGIKQLAARLNYSVFEVTGHGRLEFADLVGHLTVKNGSMTFEYGPLALAMRYGALLLINEIDLTSPEIAAGLNSVLDGSPLCIAENGGELIVPHPMFRLVATANTNGGGDDTGLYQGTQRQNLAWLDRFTICEVGYPSADVEKSLLARRFPSLPESLRATMVDYANEVRKLFMGEASTSNLTNTIEVTFSTRSLLRWGDLTVRFQPLAHQGVQPVTYALDRALAFRASCETRAMLHELAQRLFPQQVEPGSPKPEASEAVPLQGEQALRFMRGHLHRTPTVAKPRVHLQVVHNLSGKKQDGKYWIGEASPVGLTLEWGKPDTVGQQHFISAENCAGNNSVLELEARATKKITQGYALNPVKSSF
ncbi:cobaltochelatase CobS [Desulfovibrio desulfuricans]|uniref:Cobaltochelatase CobS n=1 Tax=Desulfovibrio desulfuricans TaxID=876 RepID=A0AA94HRR9_DESDE|nr:cobalamin synthase [Desulfovibrio sp. G11]SFW33264.1 cobaltochelatase CobS [Desulfovibrio desulfuricans]SPD34955.1 adenosinetriphosphatase [Desulfovibrio sp. G11]